MKKKVLLFILITLSILPQIVNAQYFGQNKVMYEQFDFEIYKSPHFDIYNYLENDSIMSMFGKSTEKWYERHQAVFGDTLKESPLILYNNHTDFKQTTVISGLIGVGTGGVTESLRRRVVIPFMVTNKETDHVLGHEMVHVFQYTTVFEDDSMSFQALANVPLWMIEGMAEFLSIGPEDNRTSMWMRDALIHNDIPSIQDLTRNPYKYFPYRYGHAFWAFVTGHWGDQIIKPLYYNTLKYGPEVAIDTLLNISADSLSGFWEREIKAYYEPKLKDTLAPPGELLFSSANSGNLNLSPTLSPDGKLITFLTDKDVISIDILMANTETKKIERRLTSTVRQSHIDDFNYIESTGSFSPDGKKYVVTTFTKGTNKLLISELTNNKAKSVNEFSIPGIDAISNPRWSPVGGQILFTGLVRGQSDLYLYDLEAQKVTQLTDDIYSDTHPYWSSDGKTVAFISERGPDTDISRQIYGSYRLCELDVATKEITTYSFFPQSSVFSPQYGPGDTSIYFLSHADGFRNLYRFDKPTGDIFRLTRLATGITGITDLAPAYSVARESGEVAYSLYSNSKYIIYKASPADFQEEKMNPYYTSNDAAYLPPGENRIIDIVENNLHAHPQHFPADSFKTKPYAAKFKLDYIGASGLGVGTSQYGTVAAGGVAALFSDMLKHHQIYTALQVNGEIYDIGGQVAYLNSKHRTNWGGGFGHIPYRTSMLYYKLDTINDGSDSYLVDNYIIERIRIFQDQLYVNGQYPLSTKLRFEGSMSYTRYSYRIDSLNNYYNGGYKIGETREKVDGPDPFFIGSVSAAFVGDNTTYGLTSPLNGFRYRFEVGKMFDAIDMYTLRFDYRKYWYKKPFSFAVRGFHYGRYGDRSDRLYPLYIGYDYYIRGYNYSTVRENECDTDENCLDINTLTGDKMLIANAEIRLPFTGPKRLTLLKSNYLYSDLVLFFDAGLAYNIDTPWQDASKVKWNWKPQKDARIPVYSTGVSLRINLFGYAILEPYIAMPFQQTNTDYTFGLSITGGGW